MATLTWLGHAAFRIDTDAGKRIYVDPFLQNNPKTPDGEKQPERVDIIAVTHGHSDHAGEVPALSKQFPDAQIFAQVEVKGWLGAQGAHFDGTSLYFAGDTCVFGDMQLIARLYKPNVAVLPIGDWFTMGPEEAALALELLGNPRCVPSHWGTFGLLTGTPDALAALTSAQVERIEPGESVEL
jgi:L-ascorbate metabolism protein UlaG (beta-lactamase superfamily)